jgi:hypothetical protein
MNASPEGAPDALDAGAGCALASAALWSPAPPVVVAAVGAAARIKEVASVQGVRSNQLQGYGLVVGLDGTGDQTTQAPFTAQSLRHAAADGRHAAAGAPHAAAQRRRGDGHGAAAAFAQPGQRSTWPSPRWAMPRACAAAR